jgi:ABC-2 type transport system permease protein
MYIPLTLPSVMILKLNITPVDIRDILTTVSIMLLSIYISILVSARIFRIGILSYGKRPGLKELVRWLKIK